MSSTIQKELVQNGHFVGSANNWVLNYYSTPFIYSNNSVYCQDTTDVFDAAVYQDLGDFETPYLSGLNQYAILNISIDVSVTGDAGSDAFIKLGIQNQNSPWGTTPYIAETVLVGESKTLTATGVSYFLDTPARLLFISVQADAPTGTPTTVKLVLDNVSVKNIVPISANQYLQTTLMVGSETGDVQTINAGKSDDGTPIYYELETQGIEFGNVFHRKKISDKIVVFTKDGMDSTIQGKADDGNYKDIQIDLSNRVNIGQTIDLEGNTIKFKWFGEADESSPVLEGFYLESVTDQGITHG